MRSVTEQIKKYIGEHLNEPVTLNDIAKSVGYSKFYTSRIFKEETGLSLFEYIRRERLTASAFALRGRTEKVLDIALVLHAEHGGGNNSTFTTHVVTSSGTDTYSAIAASLGSLKGPKHGGANLKVQNMFKDIKEHVSDWSDEDALREYLLKTDSFLNPKIVTNEDATAILLLRLLIMWI